MPAEIMQALMEQGASPEEAQALAYAPPPMPAPYESTDPQAILAVIGPLIQQVFSQMAGSDQQRLVMEQQAAASEASMQVPGLVQSLFGGGPSSVATTTPPGSLVSTARAVAEDPSAGYAEGALPPVEPTGMLG